MTRPADCVVASPGPSRPTPADRGAYALASRGKVRTSFCVPSALPVLIASSEGAVRRDSRPSRRAINFNSWSAPITASRSTQASMVRAFFMAGAKQTCFDLVLRELQPLHFPPRRCPPGRRYTAARRHVKYQARFGKRRVTARRQCGRTRHRRFWSNVLRE